MKSGTRLDGFGRANILPSIGKYIQKLPTCTIYSEPWFLQERVLHFVQASALGQREHIRHITGDWHHAHLMRRMLEHISPWHWLERDEPNRPRMKMNGARVSRLQTGRCELGRRIERPAVQLSYSTVVP